MEHRAATKRRLYRLALRTANARFLDESLRLSPFDRIRITKGIAWYCLQVLYKVLSSGHRRYSLPSRAPYNLTEGASRTRSRHQLMNPKRNRRAALNISDCEDNSSGGEDEFAQVRIFFFIFKLNFSPDFASSVPLETFYDFYEITQENW